MIVTGSLLGYLQIFIFLVLIINALMLIFVQVYTFTNYLMTKTAIIVAGGKGERMQTSVPKQFLEIKGKPILIRTLEAFWNYDNNIQIILVLPSIQIDFWKQLS